MGRSRREPSDDLTSAARSRVPSRPPQPAPLSGPDPVLVLQRLAGNAVVSRLLEDQEQSWANPSSVPAGEPSLVATIYFRTKEWATDGQDEAVLGQVARAYAPWAMRNAVNSGGERGLDGRVVGYADPRASVKPDNPTLSAERADVVARRLTHHLMEETHGLIERDFDIEKVAGGVAPADPDLVGGGPENLTPLGRLRRAEIYLAGQAMALESEQQREEPPVIEPVKREDGWERWIPYIEQGETRIIQGVATQIYGYLTYRGQMIRDTLENTGRIVPEIKLGPNKLKSRDLNYGKDGGTLPFKPVKPPWWDGRTSGYASQALGRRALDPHAVKRQTMIAKSLMLVSDMRRLNELIDQTVNDASTAYPLFMAELRKDEPDVAKLREYAAPIQHLMFVWDALKDNSIEVLQLTEDK
jgi:hypothetical protein